MKPAPFRYYAPTELDETLELLSQHGDEARILAGGQSLVPAMNLRTNRPGILVDINSLRDLAYIRSNDRTLYVGALARHRDLETISEAGETGSLLGRAAHLIAHPPVRIRGTMAGSLAFADPAAEWCLLAVLLDAEVMIASAQREHVVTARDLLTGAFTNSLKPDEMLLEIRWPLAPEGRSCIIEQSHTKGDFAVVVAAAFLAEDTSSKDLRVAVGGASPTPIRLPAVEHAAADGHVPTIEEINALIGDTLDPPEDIYGSRDYRRHLAAALVRRALSKVTR